MKAPWKALSPILVNPVVGKVNVANLVAPLKASLPIEVKVAGNSTEAKLLVFWKTLLPKDVTVIALKLMLSSPELEKA